MMSPEAPLNLAQPLLLTDQGLSPESIKFGNLTFQSDRYVCCKDLDASSGKNILKVLNLTTLPSVQTDKFPMNGESAIMNPAKKWLALRGGASLQVFDADKKEKVASQKLALTEDDSVVFWTWTDEETVGIVTKKVVHHWNVTSNSLKKVFDVHATLSGNQITAYKVSHDKKWMALTGIAKGEAPGSVAGHTQLFSVEKGVSQPLSSHAATFAKTKKDGDTAFRNVFCFIEKKEGQTAKLFIMEVGKDKNDPSGVIKLSPKPLKFPDGAENPMDFPICLLFSESQGVLYSVTKSGYAFLFDIFTGKTICSSKFTAETVFAAVMNSDDDGIMGITVKTGKLISLKLNKSRLVPHLLADPDNASLAITLAQRLGLPGAEELFIHAFNSSLNSTSDSGVLEAAKIAASAPNGILRTKETMEKLRNSSSQALLDYFKGVMEKGVLNKLETIELARLVLNQKKVKTIEKMFRENKLTCCEELGDMLMHAKNFVSPDEVNDVIKLAVAVLMKSDGPTSKRKAVEGLVQMGEYDRIVPFAKKVGYEPEYNIILQNIARTNASAAEKFAKQLINSEQRDVINIGATVDLFLHQNLLQEATSFLIEVLKEDKPQDAALQTKLIEMNLERNNISVVEAILSNEMFHHFDKTYVANLLEKQGHFKRCLDLYNDLPAVKRVLRKLVTKMYAMEASASKDDEDFIVNYCGKLSKENLYSILDEFFALYSENKVQGCLKLIVNITVKYAERLVPDEVLKFFESNRHMLENDEAEFLFCSQLVNNPLCTKSTVQRLVETGCALGQFETVIRVIKENELVPAVKEKLKNFLLLEKLDDPRPLIHLCDRFNLVAELTTYLVNNDLLKHLEIYVDKVNPNSASFVVSKLIDVHASEDVIKQILSLDSVKAQMDYEHLVEALESRNKLFLVKDLLEEKVYKDKSSEVVVHNALAKMYILTNDNAQRFLESDNGYDAKAIGNFCENVDPALAFICYEKSRDDNLVVNLCMKNELYEKLAEFCFGKDNKDLWDLILQDEETSNVYTVGEKEAFLSIATSGSTLSKTKPSLTSLTALIKSLMASDFTQNLLALLEQLLLGSTTHLSETEIRSSSLQNLLLLTAVKVRPEKVMGYIKDNRLDNYDAESIAKQCLNATTPLTKEAIEIYKAFGRFKEAIEIMMSGDDARLESADVEATVESWMEHLEQSGEFDSAKKSEVLSVIGKHLLKGDQFSSAVKYLVEANNPEDYLEVIKRGMELKEFESLTEFLIMCRKKLKEKPIDSSLVYCFCKTGKKSELEDFLLMPNLAQMNQVGERMLAEVSETSDAEASRKLLEFSVILFSQENNYSKLCDIYIQMGDFKQALDAAKKANRMGAWDTILEACIEQGKMDFARVAAANLLRNPENLEKIIRLYERKEKFSELITLLEEATSDASSASNAVFTALAECYAQYMGFAEDVSSSALIALIRRNVQRLNVAKLVRVCENNLRLEEMFELLSISGDIEKSLETVIKYPGELFTHSRVVKALEAQNEKAYIRNDQYYYKLLECYTEKDPLNISELLLIIHRNYVKGKSAILDCSRVVRVMSKDDNLPLLRKFLLGVRKEKESTEIHKLSQKKFEQSSSAGGASVLKYDLSVVNEALNELFVEEEDHVALRESVDKHPNFDHLVLAATLKEHSLIEFRKIAAKLYMRKKHFKDAMAICEKDNQFDECLYFAKSSRSREICSDLLQKFGAKKNKEYFLALLTLCNELVAPDVVMEISWKNDWMDITMPFTINHVRKTQERIEELETQMAEIMSTKTKAAEESKQKASLLNGMGGMMIADSSGSGYR